jgi:FtsZ-binding cell division protein ZapB
VKKKAIKLLLLEIEDLRERVYRLEQENNLLKQAASKTRWDSIKLWIKEVQ